ncbi:transcription factor [Coprinopsis marcescibilis]|uniref:Transcription factor n=1 Tax=Coprinopsis marcescibilis TaxID=230819 RepID=A0A5C3KLG2_COPMA|nr:transcription factor [Coprinopsis marcescibilis]
MTMKAVVKSVISGDSLVLRGRPPAPGQPPKERVLHLSDLQAPRTGTSTREDEPWAFESREFLRTFAVGKEITFTTIHSLPSSTDDVPKDLGSGEINGVDLTTELLRNGWAKLKEIKREASEEDLKKREIEQEAKAAGRGIWNPHGQQARVVHYTMPADSASFVNEWKGKPIDGIVEQVRDGTTLRIRLLMPDGDHQMVNITLAGVKSGRTASKPGETSEPYAEEARFFTESRLLQRPVKVQILSLPNAAPTPFQQSANITGTSSASVFIGNVLHPVGNIAEHLVSNGLARVVDWHAGMLASGGGMERLRAAERVAKEKRLALYAGAPVSAPIAGKTEAQAFNGQSREFDGTVVRVWSGDQISVVEKDGSKERRLQLSSTRGPKLSDPRQAAYAQEAREFLRKKLIGKHVKVHIDFIRPPEGDYEERECATIRYGAHGANVAEQIVEKGLSSVVRHKRDDENRSPDYDKLIAAEQAAATELRGIHSGKELPAPKAPLNISETSTRATQFLNNFKRTGRLPAIVDYVASGSRFKILLPKDNQVLTLVLGGIRAPRAVGRNAADKGEPFGTESLEFSTRKYMQRDVEIEIETTDKSGGFIGALYFNKNENAAVSLVKEGLATVHAYSAEALPWARQLFDAEEEAKKAKRNIWESFDAEAEAEEAAEQPDDNGALKAEYLDIIISDVRTRNNFGFSVQILNTEGIASLEKLMRDFSLHHRSPASNPPGFVPRNGELVSAKFSDGAWYRAKIRRASSVKKEAEVTFIDYGNQDTVSFANIRPLDPKFKSLPGQAHDARLSFVKLPKEDSDYYVEAIERFRSLCEGRKLVANIDHREGQVLHLRLIDPADLSSARDPSACINADLVAEGLASIDRKGCRYLSAYPQIIKKLKDSVLTAKRTRAGMFEFGDVEESDQE